jgi:hypothetical protein
MACTLLLISTAFIARPFGSDVVPVGHSIRPRRRVTRSSPHHNNNTVTRADWNELAHSTPLGPPIPTRSAAPLANADAMATKGASMRAAVVAIIAVFLTPGSFGQNTISKFSTALHPAPGSPQSHGWITLFTALTCLIDMHDMAMKRWLDVLFRSERKSCTRAQALCHSIAQNEPLVKPSV